MKHILASLLLVAGILTAQVQQSTTVTKSSSSNPSIGIVSFNGDLAAKQKLEQILDRCGWFNLKKDSASQGADIKLSVTATSPQQYAASVNAGNKSFTVSQNGNDAHLSTVDDILRGLYNLPAYCTKKIYFAMSGNNNMKEIFCCYLDGSGYERVTNNSAISTEPAWGHSNAMVYTLVRSNSLSIVLSDMQNKRQRIVSNARGLNSSAALSADGRKLALPMSKENQIDLYVIELDNGHKSTRITKNRDVESSPCWSPDGTQLCYVSDKLGVPQLYLSGITPGSPDKRISTGNNECVSPDWSRISNKVCFSYKNNQGQRVIAFIDMNDPYYTIKQVTHTSGDWEAPSWAPDGRHIVCTRSSGKGYRDLYLVDTWTNAFRPITQNSHVSLPAWRP